MKTGECLDLTEYPPTLLPDGQTDKPRQKHNVLGRNSYVHWRMIAYILAGRNYWSAKAYLQHIRMERLLNTWTPRMPNTMKNMQHIRTMLPIGRSECSSVWTTSLSPGARLITLLPDDIVNNKKPCCRKETARCCNC